MSYLSKMLLPDEQILHIASLHWVIFIPGMLLTAIGGFLGFFSYDIAQLFLTGPWMQIAGKAVSGLALALSIAGLVLVTSALVKQSSTELAITNRRLIAKYGFISRATFELMINRVTGANFDQTVCGRILGYGTILVHGAGGDISPFDGVSNPQLFQRALMDVLEHSGRQG